MSVLTNFDTNANFWELNTQFKIPKVFNDFYTSDKSKNKAHSSKIMWAIALLVDNSEANIFRNISIEDKKIIIVEDFLNEKIEDFNWDNYKSIIQKYEELSMSKLERSLYIYEQKLEERDIFIKNTTYDIENASSLDKIISSTKGIFDLISKLRDEIVKEKSTGETKGSMVESAGELGII